MELRRNPESESLGLADFICPNRFKQVVSAVKAVAGFSMETSKYQVPSLAMKLGHRLARCCTLLKAKAIEARDSGLRERTKAYQEIHTVMWEQEISCNATRTLSEENKNSTKTIPLTEDVSKLSAHLQNEAETVLTKMADPTKVTKQLWERLAEITLTRVIMFNRRRQDIGEGGVD